MKTALKMAFLLFLILSAGTTGPARAAPAGLALTVTNGGDGRDVNPGDGVCETYLNNHLCTLRAAVMEANAVPGADTITLPALTVMLTFAATPYDDAALDGDLDLTDDVTLVGAGQSLTVIDGNQAVTNARVLSVQAGVNATVFNLTIRNGANELGAGIAGGVLNLGTLTLDHVTLTANIAGGLSNYGTATLNTVTVNEHDSYLAPLSNEHGALTILNSVIADNINSGHGGGIWSGSGSLTLINTTVSGNQAGGVGGGLSASTGTITLINTTLSGNWSDIHGGGAYIGAYLDSPGTTVNLHNVTVVNNVADVDGDGFGQGGGLDIAPDLDIGPVVVNIRNSVLANNRRGFIFSTADDCAGQLTSGGYNLIRTVAGCTIVGLATGNLLGADPLLGALGDHGGASETHALSGASPAVNAGDPAGCADALGAPLTTDQRGFLRTSAGRCDIGAFEYLATPPLRLFLPLVQQ